MRPCLAMASRCRSRRIGAVPPKTVAATLKAGQIAEYPLGSNSKAYLFLAAGAVKVNGARVAAVMARQPCATKKRFASSRCRMPRSSW